MHLDGITQRSFMHCEPLYGRHAGVPDFCGPTCNTGDAFLLSAAIPVTGAADKGVRSCVSLKSGLLVDFTPP